MIPSSFIVVSTETSSFSHSPCGVPLAEGSSKGATCPAPASLTCRANRTGQPPVLRPKGFQRVPHRPTSYYQNPAEQEQKSSSDLALQETYSISLPRYLHFLRDLLNSTSVGTLFVFITRFSETNLWSTSQHSKSFLPCEIRACNARSCTTTTC